MGAGRGLEPLNGGCCGVGLRRACRRAGVRACGRAAERVRELEVGEAWSSGGLLVVLVGSLALWRVSGYTRHIPLAECRTKASVHSF